MADNVSLKISVDGIAKYLEGMADRTKLVKGWLNRVAYPKIIKAQRKRWMTEGASEGSKWKPLNPRYAKYKLKKFMDYPGSGRKMLVATGKLVDSMTGDSTTDHYKLVTDRSLEVGTKLSYARYVNEDRNFVELSKETVDDLVKGLNEYILGR